MATKQQNWRTIAVFSGLIVLSACGTEQVELVSSASTATAETTTTTSAPETTTTSTTTTTAPVAETTDTETVERSGEVQEPVQLSTDDWLDELNVQIVESKTDEASGYRAWLLRVDDAVAPDFAAAMATEAAQHEIIDGEGTLVAFESRNWFESNAAFATFLNMDLHLNGGLFGDYRPDPTSDAGDVMTFRSIPGGLGAEPLDQREYIVGSARLNWPWDTQIVDLLPELNDTESLVEVVFPPA